MAVLAVDALQRAHADPVQATDLGRYVLAATEDSGDGAAATRTLALQALGAAAKQLHDPGGAVAYLRDAIELADAAGLERRAAEVNVDLGFALLAAGDPQAALRAVDLAAPGLTGPDAARARVRRGLVLQRLGRLEEALSVYDEELPRLRSSGDRLWEARTLVNRGVLQTYRSRFDAAEGDLVAAERTYRDLEQTLAAAQVRHNLGFVAARRGDVPAALRAYDEAEALHADLGIVDVVGLADRCELLLSARLLEEAGELAARAVDDLTARGMDSDLPEARLTLANVRLLQGDAGAAQDLAGTAEVEFSAQERDAWAVLARSVGLQAARADGATADRGLLGRAQDVAAELESGGWATAAADARLLAARVALELGDVDAAEAELRPQRDAWRAGPAELRARGWYAEALLRLARDDREAADTALRAGVRALDEQRATLGATELRVRVAGHAGALAKLGARLAVEAGDPRGVLRWSERWRAGALVLRPVRPPDDAEQVRELGELREVVSRLARAALAGEDTSALLRRQAALERSIQHRSRRTSAAPTSLASVPDVDDLAAALGERALVEMLRLDGELWAVVVIDGRAVLRRCGDHDRATSELVHLRFALQRLAVDRGGAAARRRAQRAAGRAADALDDVLFAPLRAEIGDRPLVVVPTGALHAVPWAMLPTSAGRAVTVAPSAQLWCRAQAARQGTAPSEGPGRGRVVLVGCTDPPHAVREVEAVAPRYPGAQVLTAAAATVDAVGAALEGADLAHLACHGRFRADNPLFSALDLEDGPLTVHDLERRARMPGVLLLSACDSGRAGVHPGDELMGLGAALFSLGTAAFVASVAPIGDEATSRVMVRLHERLAAGASPAAALAAVVAGSEDPDERVAAGSLVCFGAG